MLSNARRQESLIVKSDVEILSDYQSGRKVTTQYLTVRTPRAIARLSNLFSTPKVALPE